MKEYLNDPSLPVLWTGEGALSQGRDYEQSLHASAADPVDSPHMTDETVAHLYYTSGTTGKPKGVMLTHKNVCSHALGTMAELNITDRDVWIHVAPMFHLADAWASFAVTWAGGRHIMVDRFDPLAVLQLIEQEKVTLTNMIPTMLNMLINHPGVGTMIIPAFGFS